jgi:hypothetical protein
MWQTTVLFDLWIMILTSLAEENGSEKLIAVHKQNVPFIVSPSIAAYRIESLHLPGHPVTPTVLTNNSRNTCITHLCIQLYPFTAHTYRESGWTTDKPGFGSRQGKRFSILQNVKTGCGAHPPSHQMDTGVPYPGVKQPGREANHSPPSSADIKNAWSCNSTPPNVFMEWFLINSVRNNLILLYTLIYM